VHFTLKLSHSCSLGPRYPCTDVPLSQLRQRALQRESTQATSDSFGVGVGINGDAKQLSTRFAGEVP